MPSKKKKYNARFPPARIKKIMQTDEEVGKVAAAVPVIISRALELFVESLMKKASIITSARQARTLTTFHLKQCILSETKFDFLKELVESIPDRPDQTGDEELVIVEGNMPPCEKPKKKRGRKPKSETQANAGPSNSADSFSDEDEDDDQDEDNTGSSEEQEKSCDTQNVVLENPNHNMSEDKSSTQFEGSSEDLPTNSGIEDQPQTSGILVPSVAGGMSEDDDYDT